jgi:hypothetical protein
VRAPRKRLLPVCCPGCGAPTQVVDETEAGFFSLQRGAVRSWIHYDKNNQSVAADNIFTQAIEGLDKKVLGELGLDKDVLCKSSRGPIRSCFVHGRD